MLSLTVVVFCLGLVTCQLDPVREQMIRSEFNHLDDSPHDGRVSEVEFTEEIEHMDADNDGCVTMAEYKAHHQQIPDTSSTIMYNNLDADSNDCLTTNDLKIQFLQIDANGDGQLTLPEYEKYMMNIIDTIILG